MKPTKRARREATELFRFCVVNGFLDENRAREVVQRIVATRPREYMGVLSHFLRLVKLDSARHTAKVETAVPLLPEMRKSAQTSLGRTYGARLNISFRDDPSLIGGMRIQVGSDVYDGSVRGRLAALKRRFRV